MILKRDSSVIFCNIVKEDSTTIYYRQKQGEQTMELNVRKADVLGYYSKKAQALAELRRADSLAKIQPKKDSVQLKKDIFQTQVVSTPPKKDSVLIKKDTLQQKAMVIKPTSDSIFLNANYKCFYKGELITKGEALGLMKRDTAACKEMKLARDYYAPVIPLGLGALVCASVFIYDAVSDGNFHWIVGGSGVLAAALAITFKHNCNVHLYKAVKRYNTNRDIAVAYIPKFELGIASNGIGLCLKF